MEEKKRVFNMYSVIVLICIILIIIAIVTIFCKKEKSADINENDQGIVENVEENEEKNIILKTGDANERAAKIIAIEKFKELGEDNLKNEDLKLSNITKDGEAYYYIASEKNSMEMHVESGRITKINNKLVKE